VYFTSSDSLSLHLSVFFFSLSPLSPRRSPLSSPVFPFWSCSSVASHRDPFESPVQQARKSGFFPDSGKLVWSLTWNREWSWRDFFLGSAKRCGSRKVLEREYEVGFVGFLEREREVLVFMWGWMVVERRRGWSFLWWPELRRVIGEGGGASVNLSHGMADLASYGKAYRDIEQQVRYFFLSLCLSLSICWKL